MPLCKCNNCSQVIQFHAEQDGTVVACPGCGLETQLFFKPASFKPVAAPIEKPVPISAASPALQHLAHIRANTCYRTLRSFIEAAFCVGLFVLIGSAIVLIVAAASGDSHGPFTIFWIIGAIVGVFVLIAWYQAAMLLIDIADTLLNEHGTNTTPKSGGSQKP